MTDKEHQKLIEAARPLIKRLAEQHGPHTCVIVTNSSVELLVAENYTKIEDYIDD